MTIIIPFLVAAGLIIIFGAGAVIYAGSYLTEDFLEILWPEIEKLRKVPRLWPGAPQEVEVVKRQDETKELWFFINHGETPITLEKAVEQLKEMHHG